MRTDNQTSRFKDAPWFPEGDEIVTVGGAGGIGSWVAFLLTKAGFRPILYDFDMVEEHNLSGQLFKQSQIGTLKVNAVSEIVNEFNGTPIDIINEAITLDTPFSNFMVAAFDNMEARKNMFEVWKSKLDTAPVTPLFIDGRLEMEQYQIFCVTPDKIDEYEEHLFNDDEVEETSCTMRQTTHMACGIASHMVSLFTNHVSNIYQRRTLSKVPFYYEYFGPAALTITR